MGTGAASWNCDLSDCQPAGLCSRAVFLLFDAGRVAQEAAVVLVILLALLDAPIDWLGPVAPGAAAALFLLWGLPDTPIDSPWPPAFVAAFVPCAVLLAHGQSVLTGVFKA